MSGVDHASYMFQSFLERISDCAIFLLSRDGRIESWNDGARAIIGYSAGEVVGKPVAMFVDAELRGRGFVERALAVAAAQGRLETEIWQVRKSGEKLWASITITAIRDDADQTAGFGVMLRDLTERLRAEEQKASLIALLEKTAGTDFLTGVANRRALDAYLVTSMARAQKQQHPLTIAMIDLDHFKAFNDSFGHQAGDRYLKEVIVVWRRVLRAESLLARYGGEEFTIIMPDTTEAQAIQLMQRLRETTPAPITCSIGIAQWGGAESADTLIGRADRGLYAAKSAGRNRVMVGGDTPRVEAAADAAPRRAIG